MNQNSVELIDYMGSDKLHNFDEWCNLFNQESGIYKIDINNVNYVGSATDLKIRLKHHFRMLNKNKHLNKHLQNYYNKYGISFVKVSILEFCSVEDLFDREQYYMDLYDVFNTGFNQSKDSRSPLGYKHTEESRLKISKAKKGVPQSKETIEKRAKLLTGKKRKEEDKIKYSISKIGKKNPNYGKKEDPEKTSKRMENLHKTPKWNTGLTKENNKLLKKMSESRKGVKPTNIIKCKLTNLSTNEIWEADSLRDLSKICPISLASINRLKSDKYNSNINKQYKLEW